VSLSLSLSLYLSSPRQRVNVTRIHVLTTGIMPNTPTGGGGAAIGGTPNGMLGLVQAVNTMGVLTPVVMMMLIVVWICVPLSP
jgi:hypothetical protein